MATQNEGLENDSAQCDPISSAKFNLWAGVIERISSDLGEAAGNGFLNTTDFNGSVVGGQQKISLSAGWGFLGSSGNRIPVRASGAVQYDLVGSGGGTINYVYVIHGGTAVVVQSTMDAPANSLLACSCSCDDTEASAINNFPSGRVNLLDFNAVRVSGADRQGKKLFDALSAGAGIGLAIIGTGANEQVEISAGGTLTSHAETFTVTFSIPPGSQGVVSIDFSLIGSYAGDYFVKADPDQDETIVELLANGRTDDSFKLFVDNPADASVGTYEGAGDISLVCVVEGFAFTPGIGGDATASEVAFSDGGGPAGAGIVPLAAFAGSATGGGGAIAAPATWNGTFLNYYIHRDCVITGYSALGNTNGGDAIAQVKQNASVIITTAGMDGGATPKDSSDALSIAISAGDYLSVSVEDPSTGTATASIILYGYFT